MKKIKIIFNIFFIVAFIIFALLFGHSINTLVNKVGDLKEVKEILLSVPDYLIESYTNIEQKLMLQVVRLSICIPLYFVMFLCSGFLFVFVNPKFFRKSTYTELIEKTKSSWAQNKSEHLANTERRAEKAKQAKIKALESELEELKKG